MFSPDTPYSATLEEIQQHVHHFFEWHINEKIIYHNLIHTLGVVTHADQIASHYQLNERELFIVLTAAWFHDLGYYEDPARHEERSAGLAEAFLSGKKMDAAIIYAVRGCILATKISGKPVNRLEEIVCDADLFHLGTDEFYERSELLRMELEMIPGKNISKAEWRRKTIGFLESHHYYTGYCHSLLKGKKDEILEKLKTMEAG